MNIDISKIIGKDALETERIVLNVLLDTDIGRYAIFKTGINIRDNKKIINNRVHKTYWFPDKNVKTGDTVVLYTKSGLSSERKNTDGTTTHFFYWGMKELTWNDNSGSVLVSIPEWRSIK